MLGLNAVIYRNTGSWGTPVWAAVPAFENVQITPAYAQLPANSRASKFAMMNMGLASVTMSARFKLKAGNADTTQVAILDAFHLRTTLDLLVLEATNTTVGAHGFRADCFIAAGPQDQGLEARLYRDFEIVIADSDNIPKWARVNTGGTLQYAEPGGAWA